MKKETKRYSLVEYCGTQVRYVKSKEEYEKILEIITKYNNRKTSPFYYGNISCKVDNTNYYEVTVHVYNKLTDKMTITDLDNFTMQFENEKELANYFKDSLRTKKEFTPDINIMYFEDKNSDEKTKKDVDKRIKYIRTLFKKDNIDKDLIIYCFNNEANIGNIDFFEQMINEFSFDPIVKKEVAVMQRHINIAKEHFGRENDNIAKTFWESMAVINRFADKLFNKLIRERNSKKDLERNNKYEQTFSRRRLRDFYSFIKNYDVPYDQRILPTRYNPRLSKEQKLLLENKKR